MLYNESVFAGTLLSKDFCACIRHQLQHTGHLHHICKTSILLLVVCSPVRLGSAIFVGCTKTLLPSSYPKDFAGMYRGSKPLLRSAIPNLLGW